MKCLQYTYSFKLLIFIIAFYTNCSASEINRQSVVARHNVLIKEIDTLNSLTLGNGRFAMTMDITGLQTFPVEYSKGVPLGTMSEWGWHKFPSERNYSVEETLEYIESHGRKIPYALQWPDNNEACEAADHIRQNPHRIHLANVGWFITKSDGSRVAISDIKQIEQKLDVWNGELVSKFEVEGTPVEVTTIIGQDNDDILGIQIKSDLLKEGRIGLTINYPYPTNKFLDEAVNYDIKEQSRLVCNEINPKAFSIQRNLDETKYYTNFTSLSKLQNIHKTGKGFCIKPDSLENTWAFFISFSENKREISEPDFHLFREQVYKNYHKFWVSGGMIDFGNVKDPRANELERRMVLSLYLTKVNCGGSSPPQETGLTYNSWYGRPHMEMVWWHSVHFALWGRPEILEKQMEWYLRNDSIARVIAQRQGFEGVRWQKMTDNKGGETVSSIGSYLIWQQPHVIYMAEMLFKIGNNKKILEKYNKVIEETAEFMADFAWYDTKLNKYILGPGVIPAQERFNPKTTFNPAFELAYWRWGLETAQQWRERLGKGRNVKWDSVLKGLSPLPLKDSLYLAAESAPDSYTNEKFMTDHPCVLGAYGMLPAGKGFNIQVMQNTFHKIWNDWSWNDTWGWDFPLTAMTAARLGYCDKAIDALLMPVSTNTYLKNGHNYQNETLRIYLPGNGGLLTALAMMATGTNENTGLCPGYPNDWDVRHEGLNKMP